MRRAAPGLLVLLAGCATVPRPVPPPDRPAEYQCRGDWQTPDSRFVVTATLAENGDFKSWHLTWLRHSTDYTVVGWVTQFDFEGARLAGSRRRLEPAPEHERVRTGQPHGADRLVAWR
jgi:hypothetical protein